MRTTKWSNEKETILGMGKEFKTLEEIGKHYGVTKQRMLQVCNRLGISTKLLGKKQLRVVREEAYQKKWGDRNDTELYATQRAKYRSKKANALNAGVYFSIPFGEIDWPTHCPILGIELDYFSDSGRRENCVSFDRIDPSKGYVSGNVAIISWRANRIKNNGTAEEHLKIANWMLTAEDSSSLPPQG